VCLLMELHLDVAKDFSIGQQGKSFLDGTKAQHKLKFENDQKKRKLQKRKNEKKWQKIRKMWLSS